MKVKIRLTERGRRFLEEIFGKEELEKRRILKTVVTRSWGTAIHILFGILAALLGELWLFTLLFLFKQVLDVIAGENPAETSGDIVSYAAGILAGLILKLIGVV